MFILSIVASIWYIKKKNLVKEDTIVEHILKTNFMPVRKNLNDIDFILKYALNVDLEKDKEVIAPEQEDKENVKVEVSDNENLEINDHFKELENIVYIYNTHQEEKYQNTYLEEFNITPSVFLASKMLKEYLKELGIGSIVEMQNVADKLHSMNLKYSGSYKVTRIFMDEAYKNNPSLKYFIDLHRDSSVYDKTVTTINGKKYAKVLIIVGLENPNYKENLVLAERIKEKIINFDKSLFRSIYKKSGAGVNGIYNQDFNKNTILLEVGGQYNNIEEVDNTLQVLANILEEIIKEDQNEQKEKN